MCPHDHVINSTSHRHLVCLLLANQFLIYNNSHGAEFSCLNNLEKVTWMLYKISIGRGQHLKTQTLRVITVARRTIETRVNRLSIRRGQGGKAVSHRLKLIRRAILVAATTTSTIL